MTQRECLPWLPVTILVAGDFLLDLYTMGQVRRISPEAPVPVLEVESEESRAGGAGNVVLNLLALGAQVTAMGRVGNDSAGETLLRALKAAGASTEQMMVQEGYHTPIKNRLIAHSQQLLRLDREEIQYNAQIPSKIDLTGIDGIAISDYGKGFLSADTLSHLMAAAEKANIPVIVDPKGRDFTKYRGATLVKPNLQEAYLAAGLDRTEPLEKVAQILLNQVDSSWILITRSELGMSLFDRSLARKDFPVKVRDVKDVTGAGDTALAMLIRLMAQGTSIAESVQFANQAAAVVVERLGCVQVTIPEIMSRSTP